ncbi:MAG: RimK family alpha-L-glutamate ligase [Myxococcaceae bacterium]|nr:RimK family alpha-L-glutamate ligase [Myxococcaceae bacterium]MCI0670930.1 RimK family alpha-L-glutamate ligase [Myxococcaceae bacterium]
MPVKKPRVKRPAEKSARLAPAAGARRARAPRKTVAILSRKRSLYSTRRLVEAVKQRGQRALVLDTLRCTMVIHSGAPKMVFRGVELRGLDVAIPRIGASITPYGLAVVNHLDMMGVPVLNNSVPVARSRDKLRCLQLLARYGIDVPRTVMAHDRSNLPRLLEEVGGLPAIVKLSRGTQGVGVMLATTLDEVQSILSTFTGLGEEIVLQEFVAESRGRDIRALVVGGQVVGAMRRQARRGEFRSNIHRGGEGKPVELPPVWEQVAVRAASIIGLEVAGVDLLEGRDGPKVMELNSSPGFEGLEAATGVDIAGAIADHALAFAAASAAGWRKPRVI